MCYKRKKDNYFDEEFEHFLKTKKVDLSISLDDKNFEVLTQLGIKFEKKCTEFDVGVLKLSMYAYYDVEALRTKKNRTAQENDLLFHFDLNRKLDEVLLRDGIITHIEEQKKLSDANVSQESYDNTLEKIERLEKIIRIRKKLARKHNDSNILLTVV